MLVRNRSTGAVITENDFRRAYPATSFPAQLTAGLLDAFDHDPVLNGAQPTGEPWQTVASDGVEQINGQWFTRYVLTPDELDEDGLNRQRDLKLSALATKRWEVETGGIEIAGLQVKTDEDTQRKITGAYVRATRDPEFTVRWKIGPASFVTLDAPTIVAIGDAVTAHIQAAFNRESELVDAVVQAATWSELVAIEW
jgi:hypothetical protein